MGGEQSITPSGEQVEPLPAINARDDYFNDNLITKQFLSTEEKIKLNDIKMKSEFYTRNCKNLAIDPSNLEILNELIKSIEEKEERIKQLTSGGRQTVEEMERYGNIQRVNMQINFNANAIFQNAIENYNNSKITLENLKKEKETLQAKNECLKSIINQRIGV